MAADVDVHLASNMTPQASQFLSSQGVVMHETSFTRRGRSPIELFRLGCRLSRLQSTIRPDVCHNVTIKPVLIGSLASRLSGPLPVVNAISGFGYLLSDAEAGRVARTSTLQAYRAALRTPRQTRVVFQNRAALTEFVEREIVRRDDARIIAGMGVDSDVFHPPASEPAPPVVMLVARMIRSKGIEEFINAALLVHRELPNVRFVLVGPIDAGNPLSYSEQELHELAMKSAVEYWGPTDDVAGAMRRSTLQVFPTHHEGLPKTLLEAAATGRAIVATNIPGCREVIEDGKNGRLVPVRDPARLAGTILELLENDTERNRLGAAARRTAVEGHTVERVVQQHLDLYSELLE